MSIPGPSTQITIYRNCGRKPTVMVVTVYETACAPSSDARDCRNCPAHVFGSLQRSRSGELLTGPVRITFPAKFVRDSRAGSFGFPTNEP